MFSYQIEGPRRRGVVVETSKLSVWQKEGLAEKGGDEMKGYGSILFCMCYAWFMDVGVCCNMLDCIKYGVMCELVEMAVDLEG